MNFTEREDLIGCYVRWDRDLPASSSLAQTNELDVPLHQLTMLAVRRAARAATQSSSTSSRRLISSSASRRSDALFVVSKLALAECVRAHVLP